MSFIQRYVPSAAAVFATTEAVLSTIDPYVPLLSGTTGILLTADGVRRLVKDGLSKEALLETTIGLGMSILAYNSFNNMNARHVASMQNKVREGALQTAKNNIIQVLNYFIGGINNPREVAVNCTLSKWSETIIQISSSPERLNGEHLIALCTITNVHVSSDTPLHSTIGNVCRRIASTIFSSRGYGAPEPRVIGQVFTNIKIS